MEASKGFVGLLLVAEVLLGLLVDSTGAYVFYAGGRDGWVLHPSESYHDWAGRNRFQVNDTIGMCRSIHLLLLLIYGVVIVCLWV